MKEVFSLLLKIKCYCYDNKFGAAGGGDCRADSHRRGLNMPAPEKTTSCSCRLPTRCSGEVNRGEGLRTDAGPRGLRGAEARGKVVGWWGGFTSGCQNVKYHSSVNVMRPQKHLTAPPALRVSTWSSVEAVKHGEQWHALWAFWYYLSRGGNCWEIFLEKQDFSKPGRTPIAN